jgi:DNA segregation ATPase FtsK/SpoIIIE-like protein
MMNRYEQMEQLGVNHFKDLPEMPYALMVMIDESYMFLAPSGIKTDEAKEEDALKGEASKAIGDIARLGRAAGVHLVLATQRPDATVIYGELKQNLAARIAAGRMDSIASGMTLDNDNATRLPGNIKGRGYFQTFGEGEQFQGYFAPQDWIDKWLAGEDPDGKKGVSEAEKPERKKERKSIMNWKKEPNVPEIVADYTEDESDTPKKKKRGGLLGRLDAYDEMEESMQSEDSSTPKKEDKPAPKAKKFPLGKKGTQESPVEVTASSKDEQLYDDDPFASIEDDPFDSAPLIEPASSEEVDKSSLLKELNAGGEEEEFIDPFGDLSTTSDEPLLSKKTSVVEEDSFFSFEDDDFSLFDGSDSSAEKSIPVATVPPAKEEVRKPAVTRPTAPVTASKPSAAATSLPSLPGLPPRPKRPSAK